MFCHHTEYIPNVWTPTLKIYCTVVLLRSQITAVSPNVERRSVSATSLTNVNTLSSVRVGLPTLSLFLRNSTVTKSFMPLQQCPWNTGTTRRWIHQLFGPYWNLPDLNGEFNENMLLRPNLWCQEFFRLFIQCISQQNTITLILEPWRLSNFPQVTLDVHLTSMCNFTTFPAQKWYYWNK